VSAGYWLTLRPTGEVKVRCLNPHSVTAFSPPVPGFDASVSHRLAAEVRGPALRVWLDGRGVTFDQGGRQVTSVAVPSQWDGPPKTGRNEGAAGITFWREGEFDGGSREEVTNIVVQRR
jgi:hypothetical protein